MLIGAWERLHGYNKWIPTAATVQSATLSRVGFGGDSESKRANDMSIGWQLALQIVWRDRNGVEHSGIFQAYEESPLYQLCEKDRIAIRFNPQRPSEFCLPGLAQSNAVRAWRLSLYALMILVVFIFLAALWFGPNLITSR